MRHLIPTTRLLTVAAACLTCSSPCLADHKPGHNPGGGGGGAAPYSIIPFLPPDLDTEGSQVEDFNEVGHAVGRADLVSGGDQALHLDVASGIYTSLTGGSAGMGVNNLNQTVGFALLSDSTVALFWSSPTADPVTLPPLPGDLNSWAFAINDTGIVVGGSNSSAVAWRVVVDEGGDVSVDNPVALPVSTDAMEWLALDVGETVNGAALAAGYVTVDSLQEATVWLLELDAQDGALVVTEPPVGFGTMGQESYSYATNTLGDVCGESGGLPFIAPAGQFVQPLPVPRITQWGRAMDVNNHGHVVGQLDIYKTKGFINGPGNYHPYLWKDGEMIDLEKQVNLGDWDRLWAANVINDGGVIAGYGRFDVESRGFLMIPN